EPTTSCTPSKRRRPANHYRYYTNGNRDASLHPGLHQHGGNCARSHSKRRSDGKRRGTCCHLVEAICNRAGATRRAVGGWQNSVVRVGRKPPGAIMMRKRPSNSLTNRRVRNDFKLSREKRDEQNVGPRYLDAATGRIERRFEPRSVENREWD